MLRIPFAILKAGRVILRDQDRQGGNRRGKVYFGLLPIWENKGREELCASLCAMGVDARIAAGDRPEDPWWGQSLGVINVAGSPICWINLIYDYSPEGGTFYRTDYGVPDPRHLPIGLKIRLVRARKFPIFGRVEDVQWQGDDQDLGIGLRLRNDHAISSAIMGNGDLSIVASHGCWLIRHETFFPSHIPSAEQWGCYQAIAERLLQVPVPGQQTPS